MGTTPRYNLPYAEPNDLVRNHPNVVSRPLAERIENIVGTLSDDVGTLADDQAAGDAATLAAAKSHANTGDAATLAAAKSHADGRTPPITVDTSVGTRIRVGSTLVYAETGWREVSGSVFTEYWSVESVQIRRTLDRVTVRMGGVAPMPDSTNSSFLNIEVGWRRDQRSTLVPYATNLGTSSLGVAMIFTGRIDLPTETTTRPGYYAEFTYTTADPWPASLPGTPG